MIRVLANTNMQGPHMGWALRACQGGSICFLHRNSVSSNRNTGHPAAQNTQKQTCFWRRFWARCAAASLPRRSSDASALKPGEKAGRSREQQVRIIKNHRMLGLNLLTVFCCGVQSRLRLNLRIDRRQGFRRDWQPRSTHETDRRHPRSCWKHRQPPRPSRTALSRKCDRLCGVGRLSRSSGRSFGEAQPLGGARLAQQPL